MAIIIASIISAVVGFGLGVLVAGGMAISLLVPPADESDVEGPLL